MSFKKLKQNRSSSLDHVRAKAEEANSSGQSDDRFWSPTPDKTGNGSFVIRFLPAPMADDANEEPTPWARYWDHGFQGPTGKWYIEKSLSTLGKDDPIGLLNSYYWNLGGDDNQDIARSRKRRLHYVSNILVINDPTNPENNGKNFLFAYGKKIFNKVNEAMKPPFPDDPAFNPFSIWEGANFRLKMRQVDGYRNYDSSAFDTPSELFDGDEEKQEELYGKLYSLDEFTDPKNFKSFEELQKRLEIVLGKDEVSLILNDDDANRPDPSAKRKRKSTPKSKPEPEEDDVPFNDDDETIDDAEEFFNNLKDEDDD